MSVGKRTANHDGNVKPVMRIHFIMPANSVTWISLWADLKSITKAVVFIP